MAHKKKYHGILVIFFGLFCCLFLGFSSTNCYAKTTLTEDEASYVIDNSFTYDPTNNLYNNLWFSDNITERLNNQLHKDSFKTAFLTAFNSTNSLNFRNDLQDFFGYWGCYSSGFTLYFRFYYTNEVNYGKFNYFHPYFYFNSENGQFYKFSIKFIDDDKSFKAVTLNALEFTANRNYLTDFTFNRSYTITTLTDNSNTQLTFNGSTSWNSNFLNTSKLENIQGVINFYSNSAVYTNFDGQNFYNIPITKLLETKYTGFDVDPIESGETGGTGTITNPSGDITGQVDLSGIENGLGTINDSINNQGQAIIDNQNQNTQAIIENQNNNAEQITSTLTENADDTIDNTNITSGDFADIVDFSPITNNQEYTAISNLWYELLTGFSNALTNVNRVLNIEFRGQQYEVNLDNFSVFIPASLKVFFGTLSTVAVVIYISKNTKHLIEDIQTASIDNVANKLTDDFESNMF